ncbi:MAG: phenylalanine--tRNA ligase subunit beta [Actinomycetota bacterium]|nr:MAG: phenylalanine--tRNA ligase subunit beta [Actinomycetota bacterium]
MRAPLSWLREFAALPADVTGRQLADRLIRAGLEVETVDRIGAGVSGPVVTGRVVAIEELTEFAKPIRYCGVDVGPAYGGTRGIICGARNFTTGDLVVVALPGAVLPGGFAIGARRTYGRTSDGMICSERELGLGDDHAGILVLPNGSADPGDDAGPLLGIGDEVLDIAVTPDRGYCLSIRGLAREAATAYGVAFTDPGTQLVDLGEPSPGGQPHPCASEDLASCDLFTLRTVVGLDPAVPTPPWLRRRLRACGVRPVSLVVDVTNYVMLETGQPLHAFDLAALRGPVTARRARRGEQLQTLDHVVRDLDPDDLVIADDRGAIGLAGTMGGADTEIGPASTAVALEAAHFAAAVVGRMSRRHRLSSEASRRFERGVDRVLAPYASARAVALLLELAGGSYLGMTGVEAPAEPTVITLPPDRPSAVAGLAIGVADVIGHLRAVGCDVTAGHGSPERDGSLAVTPPPWRPDLTDPADLVEEVIRLVGYDEVPASLPVAPAGRGLTRGQRLRRRAGTALAGAGYVEVLSYPFVGPAELDAIGLPAGDPRRRALLLANPLRAEQPAMRTTLLPGLLATLRRNVSRGSDDIAVFEAGPVVLLREGQDPAGPTGPPRPAVSGRPAAAELEAIQALLPDQPRHLAVALCGNRSPAGWWGEARPAGWADAVAAATTVADAVRAPLQVRAGTDPSFHPGRCAALVVADAVIGHAGELHPRVVAALGLPPRTAAMELSFDALVAAAADVAAAPAVGTMPVAKEDVALVVPAEVPAAAVIDALRHGGGELLESVRLFDVYTGSQVGEGRRSLAFALRFRAADRTLSAAETAAARDAAVAEVTRRHGAVLRSA